MMGSDFMILANSHIRYLMPLLLLKISLECGACSRSCSRFEHTSEPDYSSLHPCAFDLSCQTFTSSSPTTCTHCLSPRLVAFLLLCHMFVRANTTSRLCTCDAFRGGRDFGDLVRAGTAQSNTIFVSSQVLLRKNSRTIAHHIHEVYGGSAGRQGRKHIIRFSFSRYELFELLPLF